jgi:hypothetical protein
MPRTETLPAGHRSGYGPRSAVQQRCAAFTRGSLSSAPLIAIDFVKLMQKVDEYG